MKKIGCKKVLFIFIIFLFFLAIPHDVYASVPSIGFDITTTDDPQQVATSLQLLFIVSIISLAPSLLIMVTCFPRIIISLHFLRSALGTQQMPPNQILIGLALFITLAVMGNTLEDINNNALKPYANGEISTEVALSRGMEPIREFMFSSVDDRDLALFFEVSGEDSYETYDEIPNRVLIPAFILSELTAGFQVGVLIYIPFIVIDMVVASVLMAMGMMMLPPAMISLPFKILLFVSVNGWNLMVGGIINGF